MVRIKETFLGWGCGDQSVLTIIPEHPPAVNSYIFPPYPPPSCTRSPPDLYRPANAAALRTDQPTAGQQRQQQPLGTPQPGRHPLLHERQLLFWRIQQHGMGPRVWRGMGTRRWWWMGERRTFQHRFWRNE